MKKIPIDNVISCKFSGRTPGALQGAFWRTLHDALDNAQAHLLEGKRVNVKELVSSFTFARPLVVDAVLGPIILPAVPVHVRVDAIGIVDPDKVEYYREFSIRIKAAWQRDVILAVLHRFAGKYFRFDFGAKGADKRRLPMGRRLATKGRELPAIQ